MESCLIRMTIFRAILFGLGFLSTCCYGFGSGTPPNACGHMIPLHYFNYTESLPLSPQNKSAPFEVKVDKQKFGKGTDVIVQEDDQPSGSSGSDSPGTAAKQKLASVMENLKGALKKTKQCDDVQERKRKATIKVQLGWHNFKSQTKSYSQVKSNRGGGVINLWVQRTITYPEIQQKALETFFPSGKSSHLGCINDYDYFVGNSRCETYDTESFSVETIFQEGGSRARIYLFTKRKEKKVPVTEISDSSGTSDEELPVFNLPLEDPFKFEELDANNSSCLDTGTPSVSFKAQPAQTSSQGATNICGICADRVKNSFFIPCGHSLCAPCAVYFEESQSKECPFCKVSVNKVGTLYE